MAKTVCKILGVVFLLVGVLGIIAPFAPGTVGMQFVTS